MRSATLLTMATLISLAFAGAAVAMPDRDCERGPGRLHAPPVDQQHHRHRHQADPWMHRQDSPRLPRGDHPAYHHDYRRPMPPSPWFAPYPRPLPR